MIKFTHSMDSFCDTVRCRHCNQSHTVSGTQDERDAKVDSFKKDHTFAHTPAPLKVGHDTNRLLGSLNSEYV